MKDLKNIKCFVLDMDGTIYLGNTLFDFTKDFLSKLTECGRDFVFFTNNSSKNTQAYIDKLKAMGIEVSPSKMLSPNQIIIDYIKKVHAGKSVYVAGTHYLENDFINNGIILDCAEPQIGVLGFDTTLTYEKLIIICDIARAGKPVYCVNPDFNCPIENGGFIPDCGSMAALVTAATGVVPEYFGKPSRHTLDYILAKTGYCEDEIAFVGDRLMTDIAIAQDNNATSILVLSGETKLSDLESSPFKPDLIFNSIKELGQAL